MPEAETLLRGTVDISLSPDPGCCLPFAWGGAAPVAWPAACCEDCARGDAEGKEPWFAHPCCTLEEATTRAVVLLPPLAPGRGAMRMSTMMTVMLSRLPRLSAPLARELAAFFTACLLLPLFLSSPLPTVTATHHFSESFSQPSLPSTLHITCLRFPDPETDTPRQTVLPELVQSMLASLLVRENIPKSAPRTGDQDKGWYAYSQPS